MTLSGALPETSSEVFARPAVNLALTLQTVKLGLEGYYGLEQTNGQTASTLQNAGSTLTLTAKLPLSLSFDGSVGFAWDDAVGMHVPFSLELDGAYRDLLTYKLYGGYRIERPSYFDIWSSYHFLDQGAALMPSLNWYGGVSSQMRLGPTFALDAGVGYTQASATVIPSSFVQSEQLFSFLQLPTETLGPSVSLSWNPPGPFSLNLGWKGAFINPGAFAPVSTFTLDAELNAPSGKFGGSLSGSSNIYSDPSLLSEELPNLTLSGFFRVSDGVLFRLDVNDILSPLLPGGRKLWDTYTQPGFHIVLRTQISL